MQGGGECHKLGRRPNFSAGRSTTLHLKFRFSVEIRTKFYVPSVSANFHRATKFLLIFTFHLNKMEHVTDKEVRRKSLEIKSQIVYKRIHREFKAFGKEWEKERARKGFKYEEVMFYNS